MTDIDFSLIFAFIFQVICPGQGCVNSRVYPETLGVRQDYSLDRMSVHDIPQVSVTTTRVVTSLNQHHCQPPMSSEKACHIVDFDGGMDVCARRVSLSMSETADHLRFSHTRVSRVCRIIGIIVKMSVKMSVEVSKNDLVFFQSSTVQCP